VPVLDCSKPMPGWVVCFNPLGCDGQFQYLRSRDVYFSGRQLTKVKSAKRSCMRCEELGLPPDKVVALHQEREQEQALARAQGQRAGGGSGGRHCNPSNRARARTCVAYLESAVGQQLLQCAADHPDLFEAYAYHLHGMTRNRGAPLPHAEIVRVGLAQWREGRSEGGGKASDDCPTSVLNLGCGWRERIDAVEEAAVSLKIPVEALAHVDVFQYWADPRIMVGDMYDTANISDERFTAGASFDVILAVNCIYQMSRADQFVHEVARLLRNGGVAVIVQYDGFLGEAILAVARAAVERDDLAVVRYEEGQAGARAAAATAEADARSTHAPGAVALAPGAGVAPVPIWPANVVVLVKREPGSFKGGAGFEPVELPRRNLRSPLTTGATFGLTYTVLGHYHGQTIRGSFTSPHALAKTRHGEHLRNLRLGQHPSPKLQRAYDEFMRLSARPPSFDSRPLRATEASVWGNEYGVSGEFEYRVHKAAEDEGSCVLGERLTQEEQRLLDLDSERYNACPVAGSTSRAGCAAGGVSSHGEALCMSHQVIYLYSISSLLLGIWGPFFIFPSHGEGLASVLTVLCPCSHGEALCMLHQVIYRTPLLHYHWGGSVPLFQSSRAVVKGWLRCLTTLCSCSHGEALRTDGLNGDEDADHSSNDPWWAGRESTRTQYEALQAQMNEARCCRRRSRARRATSPKIRGRTCTP
jgi:SAM-dependent methyltransferase